MVWENELNERKRTILKSIIDNYIESAQPVGSRTIARKHELGLGSATIRNEMADLEELGYITQPHTSAGRIPSDKGYRFYVDNLMQVQSLAQDEMIRIRKAMDERIEEINRLFRKASIIISNITGYTSVVVSPQLSRTRIKSIQLLKIDEKSILVVVVAGGGIVKNKLISHNQVVEDAHLAKLNQAANLFLADKSIGQLTMPVAVDLQREINMPAEVILAILESVDECIKKIETTDIYLEGITNILNYPEFSDLIKAREILDLLNEEEIITGLVRSVTKDKQFDFKIGSENQIDEMKDLSIITTVYGREGKDVGTIGVIGPTRMAYSKVVSSIKYIRELLNKEIIRLFGDDP
ncbi:MAG: heat-inducible transcription repressor HrcA [Clostridiaceae bacterium]|jgi:heat-inducible transcriptional repressor|nr:heat-inducible transcription repressor HrcA [Clostridiaceae bacterium]